jgi:hypothetical protein
MPSALTGEEARIKDAKSAREVLENIMRVASCLDGSEMKEGTSQFHLVERPPSRKGEGVGNAMWLVPNLE